MTEWDPWLARVNKARERMAFPEETNTDLARRLIAEHQLELFYLHQDLPLLQKPQDEGEQ